MYMDFMRVSVVAGAPPSSFINFIVSFPEGLHIFIEEGNLIGPFQRIL